MNYLQYAYSVFNFCFQQFSAILSATGLLVAFTSAVTILIVSNLFIRPLLQGRGLGSIPKARKKKGDD